MGNLLSRVLRRDPGPGPAAGGDTDPVAEAARLLDAVHRAIDGRYPAEPDVRAMPEVQALFDADEAVRAAALMQLVAVAAGRRANEAGTGYLVGMLSRRKLSIPAWQLGPLLSDLEDLLGDKDRWRAASIMDQVSAVIERSVGDLSGEDRTVANAQVARIIAIAEMPTTASGCRPSP